jgi:hypothetical protein
MSHITTGFIENSPSQLIVRVDEAFNGTLASSVFNYANSTKEGLVDNTLTSYDKLGKSTVWREFVNSNFPLFPESLLIENDAVFGGLVDRQLNDGPVATVSNSKPGIRLLKTNIYMKLIFYAISGTLCTRGQSLSQSM